MHIYAFGSLCRGEVDHRSDIDLLAVVDGSDERFDRSAFSVYSYERLKKLWEDGNPFAWHLATESRIIYSSNGADFIKSIGKPSEYRNCKADCLKFYRLYRKAIASILSGGASKVFELSTIFLSIRNFATCYSLGLNDMQDFSRHSALHLGENSLKISKETYETLERARILSVRGTGEFIDKEKVDKAISEIETINNWMEILLKEVEESG
jgi:hypothetical protein